jgi:hypothetical protein
VLPYKEQLLSMLGIAEAKLIENKERMWCRGGKEEERHRGPGKDRRGSLCPIRERTRSLKVHLWR